MPLRWDSIQSSMASSTSSSTIGIVALVQHQVLGVASSTAASYIDSIVFDLGEVVMTAKFLTLTVVDAPRTIELVDDRRILVVVDDRRTLEVEP